MNNVIMKASLIKTIVKTPLYIAVFSTKNTSDRYDIIDQHVGENYEYFNVNAVIMGLLKNIKTLNDSGYDSYISSLSISIEEFHCLEYIYKM